MNNCPRCGRVVEDLDVFCRYCGARLIEETVPVVAPSAPPDELIKDVIVRRLDGIKNRDEGVVRSMVDVGRYSKFDDWPPWGRQDAETGLKNEFGAFQVLKNYNYDFTNFKLDVMGDVAIATFHFHYTGEMRSQSFEVNSRVTTVLLKEAAGWKIIHEHYSRMGERQTSDAGQQQRRRRRWF
jgi:DNA-directed RNA polymerase subunit RPC12/RpoP